MARNKNKTQKPLTLDGLIAYGQEVLFPAMEERFATKTDFNDFKNESLTNQDAMLKKLDILLSEKEIREYQEKKEKEIMGYRDKSVKRASHFIFKRIKRDCSIRNILIQ